MSVVEAAAKPERAVENWRALHAAGYFANHRKYQERLHDLGITEIEEFLGLTPDDVLLEVGCGYGRALWHLLPRVKRAVGVDLAEEPLREGRELLKGRGEVDLRLGDGVSLGVVESQSVSAAFAFTVLQHVPRAVARGYMAEMARTMRPGGRVCVQFLTGGDTRADQEDLVREQSLSYSAGQIVELAEGAGLVVTRLERRAVENAGYAWYWLRAEKAAQVGVEDDGVRRMY